jgi:tRNA(fMet)-specific endonuclease VapC
MPYSLDSNVCIAVMNQRASTQLLKRLDDAFEVGEELYVSSIVAHELWYGVAGSARPTENAERLLEFLRPPFRTLSFQQEDAYSAGEIRAELRKRGTPIGPYDTLIAGQALTRGLTLVTANTREFARVDGLKTVDWSI